jgi:hypothetical protein
MIPRHLQPTVAAVYRETADLAAAPTVGTVTLGLSYSPQVFVRASGQGLLAQVSVVVNGNVNETLIVPPGVNSVVLSQQTFGTVTSVVMPSIAAGTLRITTVTGANAPVVRRILQRTIRGYANLGRRSLGRVQENPSGLSIIDRPEFYTSDLQVRENDLLLINDVWYRVESAPHVADQRGPHHAELILSRV